MVFAQTIHLNAQLRCARQPLRSVGVESPNMQDESGRKLPQILKVKVTPGAPRRIDDCNMRLRDFLEHNKVFGTPMQNCRGGDIPDVIRRAEGAPGFETVM